MHDQPDRQRIRPTVQGRARLLAAVEMTGETTGPPHAVDPGALGEYAELLTVRGQADADAAVPEIAMHLADGCEACAEDLRELTAALTGPAPSTSAPSPSAPSPSWETGIRDLDSGIHSRDLPDVRAAEAEAARRQRLRKIRDWLLVIAAIAILAMGLSLIGLAYLSSQSGPARGALTPVPAGPPAPGFSSGGSGGRVAPSNSACPATHPIKGNRPSMIYHLPGGEFYEATRPEDCFASPAEAEAAGYRRSQR